MKHKKKTNKLLDVTPTKAPPVEKLIDGKDIRHIRVDLDIKQSELAQRMGIATATLSRIEKGRNLMSRPYYKLLMYVVHDLEAERHVKVSYVFKDA